MTEEKTQQSVGVASDLNAELDVLIDGTVDAAKTYLQKLKNLNLCGCIGAINGEPYCPCKMQRLKKSILL